MKKLTIGLFIDSFFPMIDGVIMVVDQYARKLSKYANVIVFAPDGDFDDSKLPYRVIRSKSVKVPFLDYSLPLPKLDAKFQKKLEEFKLDIVHIHSPATIAMMGVKYAKKHHALLIGTMHSQYEQDLKRAFKSKSISTSLTKKITRIYEACDECWAVNSEVARIFHEEYGYSKYPKVMGNATDMKLLEDSSYKDINSLYGISRDEKVFLFVGRLNALKNVFFLVDAMKELKKKHVSFSYQLLFVGNGQDEKRLKTYVKEQKLEDHIRFIGRVKDRILLASFYKRANLFLFPSLYDANSLVQIEAASQKTPTLFLKGSVTSTGVEDNKNGFFSENDPKKYASRIEKIMKNEKLLLEVSTNAYETLYRNWDMVLEEVYQRYLSLSKEKEAQNHE